MRKGSLAAFAASTVVLALCAVAPGTALASTTFNFTMPIAGDTFNQCTGETVTLQGTAHFVGTADVTLTGTKTHIEMNTTSLTGTTPTGVRYVMSEQTSDTDHSSFDVDGPVQ